MYNLDDINEEIVDSVISDLCNRKSVLLHSCGGSGKTYILKEIKEKCENMGMSVALTSTTGISAFHLGVNTIHSYSGLGIGNRKMSSYISFIRRNKTKYDVLRKLKVLIIDEISMLGESYFEKLNILFKELRYSTKYFGGIRLVTSGDFLQLPPINDNWIFNSGVWNAMEIITYCFHRGIRYTDQSFFRMLLRIRLGKQTEKDIRKLHRRVRKYNKLVESGNDPLCEEGSDGFVRLYSHNYLVDDYNNERLEKLSTPAHTYYSIDTIPSKMDKKRGKQLLSSGRVEKSVTLKEGAQVMLITNLDTAGGLVNGLCGIVESCNVSSVNVKFFGSDDTTNITYHTFENEVGKHKISRSQLPLVLGWSYSIHKSQGMTLDKVIIDLGKCFAEGQAYVALSRCKSLNGIYLIRFSEDSIKTNQEALNFELDIIE